MRVIQSKFLIFFKTGGGGAPGAPVLDPPLSVLRVICSICPALWNSFDGVKHIFDCIKALQRAYINIRFKDRET